MLRVTIPDFKDASRMISYEAPEASEMNIREYIISQFTPKVQLKCKIETVAEQPIPAETASIKLPEEKPLSKERIEMETKAKELGIKGINLYTDEKLKERIELKSNKPAPEQIGQTITNGN